MNNIRKKSLFIIIVILMFVSVIAFLALNINKPSKSIFAAGEITAGETDIIYTVKMNKGGKQITCGGEAINFLPPDGSGYKTGTAGGVFNTGINFIAAAEKYYEIDNFTITWDAGKTIRINDNDNSSGTFTSDTLSIVSILVLDTSEVTGIAIAFDFKASEYKISAKAKEISNNQVSNENDDAAGAAIELTGSDAGEIATVKINDMVNLAVSDSNTSRRFISYVLWNTEGFYESQNLPANGQIIADKDFLDKYLSAKGEILIIGGFVNTWTVKLSDSEYALTQNFVEAIIYNPIIGETIECKTKSDIEKYFGESSSPIDEGSYIRIIAKNMPYYKFTGFTDSIGTSLNTEYRIDYLRQNYDIDASYGKSIYTIENIEGKNSFGAAIDLAGNVTVKVGNDEKNQFSIGDEINIELSSDLIESLRVSKNYYDNYFSIKFGSNQRYEDLKTSTKIKITVDEDFLNKYLNINTDSIKIVSNFINRFTFSVILDGKDLGDYIVSANGQAITYTDSFSAEYNYGTVITVTLNPLKYSSLSSLGGVYSDEKQGNRITVLLNSGNREMKIVYAPSKINLFDMSDVKEGYTTTDLNNLSIGDSIMIVVDTSSNDEIKSWKINGVNVLKNLPADAEYKDGVLKITLTEKWLEKFKNFEIMNEVKIGMKSSLLMLIILPSVFVPILIIVLLALIITNAKRKKFIKAELTEKIHTEATRNVSGFVADLREGKDVGQVTDEDVKREMKKKKNTKD